MLTQWWDRRRAARDWEHREEQLRNSPGAVATWMLADGTVQVRSLRNGQEVRDFCDAMSLDDRLYTLTPDEAPPADMDSPDHTSSPTHREDDPR